MSKELTDSIKNATIEELMEKLEYCGHDGYYNELYYSVIEEIKRRLKKPKEQRRTGHWKYSSSPTAECDQCGHIYPGFLRLDNYCPHCGSFNAEKGGAE